MRQYDRAIESELGCLQRQPKLFFAHVILGWAYEQKHMFPEALSELRQAVQITNNDSFALSAYGEALAEAGDRRGAREVVTQLQERAQTKYVSAYDMALIYAALGDKDQAFECLARAQRERDSFLPYITWDRRADSLRADSRYHKLLQQLGLTETASASLHVPASSR